jgi:hypothetical protein
VSARARSSSGCRRAHANECNIIIQYFDNSGTKIFRGGSTRVKKQNYKTCPTVRVIYWSTSKGLAAEHLVCVLWVTYNSRTDFSVEKVRVFLFNLTNTYEHHTYTHTHTHTHTHTLSHRSNVLWNSGSQTLNATERLKIRFTSRT